LGLDEKLPFHSPKELYFKRSVLRRFRIMGRKQLIWSFLLTLFIGIPGLIQAKSSTSQQMNSQGDMQGQGTAFSQGYNVGYPQGYEQGQTDRSKCKTCEDIDVPHVKYPHCGCHDEAAEHEYKGAFRAGFEQGYRDAFNGREQQPPLAADATSAPVETQAPAALARTDVSTETGSCCKQSCHRTCCK
jgi:hypothetical protein